MRDNRIKQYIFSPGSLTVNAAGSGNVYSDYSINGTIQNIVLQDNNYTTTGSIIVFASGLGNSGTGLGELIITLRAGSAINTEYYPFAYGALNQAVFGSGTTGPTFFQKVIHGPLRLAFSGCGNGTSGVGLIVNYI